MSKEIKKCNGCKRDFDKKATGRIKISIKQTQGEKTAWLCPACRDRIKFS